MNSQGMITTIYKDILTVKKGVIVHSVNCLGAVGGLAGAIARKWPKNANKYREHIERTQYPITLLGKVFEVNVAHNVIVANLFGHRPWDIYDVGTHERQTDYGALLAGFRTIANTHFTGNETETLQFFTGEKECNITLKDIFIPYKIGCGLGGGDWGLVSEMLAAVFAENHHNVYICKHE